MTLTSTVQKLKINNPFEMCIWTVYAETNSDFKEFDTPCTPNTFGISTIIHFRNSILDSINIATPNNWCFHWYRYGRNEALRDANKFTLLLVISYPTMSFKQVCSNLGVDNSTVILDVRLVFVKSHVAPSNVFF